MRRAGWWEPGRALAAAVKGGIGAGAPNVNPALNTASHEAEEAVMNARELGVRIREEVPTILAASQNNRPKAKGPLAGES